MSANPPPSYQLTFSPLSLLPFPHLSPPLPPPADIEKYITVEKYVAEEDDEMSFPKGVTVDVLQKSLDGWWLVKHEGKTALAPATFLKKKQPGDSSPVSINSTLCTNESKRIVPCACMQVGQKFGALYQLHLTHSNTTGPS